jgi:hypothetical protein
MVLLNKIEYLCPKKGARWKREPTLAIPSRRASSVALVLTVIKVRQTMEIMNNIYSHDPKVSYHQVCDW